MKSNRPSLIRLNSPHPFKGAMDLLGYTLVAFSALPAPQIITTAHAQEPLSPVGIGEANVSDPYPDNPDLDLFRERITWVSSGVANASYRATAIWRPRVSDSDPW